MDLGAYLISMVAAVTRSAPFPLGDRLRVIWQVNRMLTAGLDTSLGYGIAVALGYVIKYVFDYLGKRETRQQNATEFGVELLQGALARFEERERVLYARIDEIGRSHNAIEVENDNLRKQLAALAGRVQSNEEEIGGVRDTVAALPAAPTVEVVIDPS